MRTIRVTGKGKIKVKPDMTRLTITLEGMYKDYGETIKNSAEDSDALKELMTQFGFEKSDLKTLRFNVDTEYESYREKDVYKQRFLGYKFVHVLKLEFESDNDRLGKILYALTNSDIHPEFRISYTVKDPEVSKNELLGNAVKDAKTKATVLADASGVSLKNIQNIDYSWGEINFEVEPMRKDMISRCMLSEGSYDMDIEPDDIEVTDTVTVVWEIE